MGHAKSTNPDEFILPDLGEGVHEAELIKWRVKVGDTVAEHDILAEMETDKALVEVPSPRPGIIASLNGKEGEILHVGNVLVTYQGAAGQDANPASSTDSRTPAKTERSNSNGSTRAAAHPPTPQAKEDREDAGTVVGNMSGGIAGVSGTPGKALATPAVRRLARDLGVDIDRVQGTGIGGRVTERDVRSSSADRSTACDMGEPSIPPVATGVRSPAPRPAVPAARPSVPAARPSVPAAATARSASPAPEGSTRIAFRGVRRTIANRLRESVSRAVHFNVMDEADVSTLDSLRRKLAAASGEKLSFLPFVCSAIARVLRRPEFAALNSTVDDDANGGEGEIIQHRGVHLGIATDTENGLMVPVIRDADALGVLEIGRQIASIAAAARSRSIPREQLVGSTFTISNVGSHAGRFATPIINYPEVGILGVGRARQAPVVRNGGLFIGNLLPLSLACDHRVVDGATAATALAAVLELLQDPDQLLGPARG
ncbi:MAG: 2-oxo acid dehydrogenase subunit E2 [Phycisphaeraceae bacterium]|nr:2-oxo acid dehydrogenase subunit E2 [Phycisphaerae bacterium]MBX3391682.1 2-oxo acid dehydrogenase subunit E2 [Phycisphaeraceae bacterium]